MDAARRDGKSRSSFRTKPSHICKMLSQARHAGTLSLHDLPCDSSGVRMDTGAIELIVILHRKTLQKV